MTTTVFPNVAVTPATGVQVWSGRVLSGVAVLFLTMDAMIKVLQLPVAVEGTKKVGYPAGVVLVLGIIQLICLAAYLIPRTRVLGAILWTGYLGGAVATHVRMGDPLFSHVLAPVYVAAVLWGGLCLRDARLRAVVKGAR
ncbi:MAG TPA: DoxX family protein [Thermoanaerobaculia bacterium]|nr:DoxX family protein [Thermoanaerobaculia bacterium]